MKIIVLPGLDGADILRRDFEDAFADEHSLQLISYPENASLDYQDLTEHTFSKLPVREDYCIVAESFSAPIAIRIAERANAHLRAIVFVCSFACAPIPFAWIFLRLTGLIPVRSQLFTATVAGLLLGARMEAACRRALRNHIACLPVGLVRRRVSLVLQANDLQRLSRIRIPMLYLQSTNDRLVGRGAYRSMKNANDRLSLERINGPHFLLGAKPLSCAEAVTKFIARL